MRDDRDVVDDVNVVDDDEDRTNDDDCYGTPAGAPDSTATVRRQRSSHIKQRQPRGGEGGEEEAPAAVSALATSLPRDPMMRVSAGGFRGRRVVQVRPPPGGRRGGGREGPRMQRECGWNQSRVESRVIVVQGGGEGRRGGRGTGGLDVIGRIRVGMGRD